MKHGKKYGEAAKLVDRATQYDPAEAIGLVKKTATAKFDETVEVHIRTGCDGRHAEQQIRGAVVLPNGTGKTVKVLVFAKGAWLGMNGAILLAFLLSFPANELLLPVCVMILSSGGSLAQAQTMDVSSQLMQAGWTWKTALCVMVFTLFHWPCSTTVLTIRKETESRKWTLLAVLLPTVIGLLFCRLIAVL